MSLYRRSIPRAVWLDSLLTIPRAGGSAFSPRPNPQAMAKCMGALRDGDVIVLWRLGAMWARMDFVGPLRLLDVAVSRAVCSRARISITKF